MHFFHNSWFGPNELIKSILSEDWNSVKAICDVHPSQAKAWSTRKGFFDGEHDSHVLPLHQAAALKPPIHAMDALIQAYPQAVLCKETSFKRLPIHVALQSGDSCQVVRLLLSYAPDSASERDVLDRIPLHYACSNGASFQTISVLLSSFPEGAAVKDLHGWLPLHVACFYGASYQVIHKLMAAYPDAVYKQTDKGSTPVKIMKKVQTKDKERILELLTRSESSSSSSTSSPHVCDPKPVYKKQPPNNSSNNYLQQEACKPTDSLGSDPRVVVDHGNVRRRRSAPQVCSRSAISA